MDSIEDRVFALLFSPRGRIGKRTYVYSTLIVPLFWLLVATDLSRADRDADLPVAIVLAAVLWWLWSNIVMGIKRCHDRDRSGWFVLLALVPIVNLWYWFDVHFVDGTKGANRFGPCRQDLD